MAQHVRPDVSTWDGASVNENQKNHFYAGTP
jgi:hypothetical protein